MKLSHSRIQFIQSCLKKQKYYDGLIDGIIGPKTQKAVEVFQQNNKINVTAEFDETTFSKLEWLMKGYDIFKVNSQNVLYEYANKNGITAHDIIISNPKVNPFLLTENENIIVPNTNSIVPTDINYTYEILEENIESLKTLYPFIQVDIIGTSVDYRNIYRIRIGEGENKVSYNASHHANEWITTPLLMSWLEKFLRVYTLRGSIKGYSTEEIWKNSTIDIIPMVNPDGVELVVNGLENITVNRDQILEWNNYSEDFSLWKANINGVDLNRNYDAGFYEYKEIEEDFGAFGPGPAMFAGPYPGSEPESRAMIELTRSNNYRLVLAFHTQGQVIFWDYRGLQPEESYDIALTFSDVTGYALDSPDLSQSFAGYKDWFIKEFRRPGYTIEVGSGVNPLPMTQFPLIYENNEELLLLASII